MKHPLIIKIVFFMAVTTVLVCAPASVSALTQTFEVQVNASENDAEEDSLGAVILTDATLDLGGLYRKVGLRFASITLPKNAPITKAYIEFTTAAGEASANTTFTIEALYHDNPGVFTTGALNISSRSVYGQAVDWVMDYAWSTTDQVHQSADITVLVQKLVDRSGWASGNAMGFVISNGEDVFRKAKSWNADPTKAPKLHIEYAVNVVDVRVSASTDDIHQSSIAAAYTVTNGDNVVLSGSYVYSGLRFQNVNIPQGAVINYACLKFVAKNTYAATTGYMRLQGEKRLDPPAFSTVVGSNDSLYKRTSGTPVVPKTTYAQWSNNGVWTAGTEYTSVDIKPIIQEIVGQAGWGTSTKSLALNFYYTNLGGSQQRQVWSYNGDPTKAALLHIEYGQAPVGAGTDPPVISLSNTELGRSAFEGSAAASQHFSMMNSGATALNYAMTITYTKGSGWLSLTPSAASGTLGAGEEQNFSVNFTTTGLIAGTYDAIIKFTDANAANSPQEVRASLSIMPQAAIQCGDVPLYTQNIASPAVMILLDTSGSMLWEIDLVKETDVLPVTPDLSAVVKQIVDRDGWASGNAITFIIDKVSGSGFRYARSFDGYNPSAALFHVEYNDGSGVKTIETRIKKATDDGECATAIPFSTSTQKLTIGSCGVALRFEGLTIPKNSTITNAWMKFVPYQTLSVPITVKVSAHASDNSPTFSEAVTVQLAESQRPRTTANVTWNVESWTGVTVETKIDVAKTVIGELVKDTGISWGFGAFANSPACLDGEPEPCVYNSAIDYTIIFAGCNPHTAAHQAKLQAAVAGLVTHSSTPYAPSMDAGRKYFAKEKADIDWVYFKEASCQPKFLIELSDGMGNVPSMSETGLYSPAFETYYKNLVATKANALADAGVSTIGIGFGIPEGEIEQIYALAEVANTRGKASTSDSLYAMHQEDATTGKGLPYLATNKDELMNIFRTIMNSVKGAVFFGSAPAATTSTDLGDMLLVASFNAGNWTGDLEAVTKDTTTGKWDASLWKASEKMPATRSVWTVDASNNATSYTDSTLAGDNYLCKKIGDIVHSTPMVVGVPPFFYAFDNYSSFKRNLSVTSPREKMAYVGSNDGLLHAFSLETGQERWAFLPKSLQAKLNTAANGASYDPCATAYCHNYLLDGSPQVADVYGLFGGANKWRTLLVVGQRGGGTAYTALDVTNGESFGAGADQAKFLWELTDTDLGESWSEAAIERVSYPGGGSSATAWGVFVSSGYSENDNTQYLKEGYLYGLEANTGTGLWSAGTNTINKIKMTPEAGTLNFKALSGSAPGPEAVVRAPTSGAYGTAAVSITNGATGSIILSNVFKSSFANNEQIVWSGGSATVDGTFSASTASQMNNALSSPVMGNFYAPDHTEDCIYLGDLYGTMYRVDSIGKGQTPSVSKLFKFNPYPSVPDEHPIRGKASVAQGSSGLWVYYGTGRYETAADKVNLQQQYFFGLKDAQAPRATPYSIADLTTLDARFTTATIGGKALTVRTINGTNASANPWAIKLFAGQSGWGGPATIGGSERVFTKPLVVGGIVFFTTFIPDADICTGSGDTYVFALDYKTGLPPSTPVFDLNGDGKFTDADKVLINGSLVVPIGLYVGRGQGSAPVLFKDTMFINLSNPPPPGPDPDDPDPVKKTTGGVAIKPRLDQNKIRVESWKHN